MDRRLEDQEKYDIEVNQEKERGKEVETARDKEADRPSMGDRNGERDNGRQVWGRFQMQICCKHTARQAHTHRQRHTRTHLRHSQKEITLALRHLRSVSKCQKWNINILGPHLGRILRGGALMRVLCMWVCPGQAQAHTHTHRHTQLELGNVDS